MERLYKSLQIAAIVVVLLTPLLFSIGYAYDWGFLDSFAIEHQMFFKAPQEYFGITYVLFGEFFAKLLHAINSRIITIFAIVSVLLAVTYFSLMYWVRHPKLWTKLYYRYSNWGDHVSKLLNVRLVESMANAYIITAVPMLVIAGVFYLFLLVLSPGLIGYSNGQEAAAKFKAEWKPETCTPKKMVGCTQILQAGKLVAAGKLIVASEKQAAIFDGYSVQIYSLSNRDIKTILSAK